MSWLCQCKWFWNHCSCIPNSFLHFALLLKNSVCHEICKVFRIIKISSVSLGKGFYVCRNVFRKQINLIKNSITGDHCYKCMQQHLSHDMTNTVRPAKTQITLGICPVWSESLLSAWRKLGSLATHWAHSEDSDRTGRMPRLIWVFAGHTHILLVLSCRGSFEQTSQTLIHCTLHGIDLKNQDCNPPDWNLWNR